ncbi:hypothetical protein F5I97DRAFT_1827637 [Phlebopus sp. FC_14]|nr:hypothetical protein F5I97DRAFT_1827637 [Phlebopus sp. FC_14]
MTSLVAAFLGDPRTVNARSWHRPLTGARHTRLHSSHDSPLPRIPFAAFGLHPSHPLQARPRDPSGRAVERQGLAKARQSDTRVIHDIRQLSRVSRELFHPFVLGWTLDLKEGGGTTVALASQELVDARSRLRAQRHDTTYVGLDRRYLLVDHKDGPSARPTRPSSPSVPFFKRNTAHVWMLHSPSQQCKIPSTSQADRASFIYHNHRGGKCKVGSIQEVVYGVKSGTQLLYDEQDRRYDITVHITHSPAHKIFHFEIKIHPHTPILYLANLIVNATSKRRWVASARSTRKKTRFENGILTLYFRRVNGPVAVQVRCCNGSSNSEDGGRRSEMKESYGTRYPSQHYLDWHRDNRTHVIVAHLILWKMPADDIIEQKAGGKRVLGSWQGVREKIQRMIHTPNIRTRVASSKQPVQQRGRGRSPVTGFAIHGMACQCQSSSEPQDNEEEHASVVITSYVAYDQVFKNGQEEPEKTVSHRRIWVGLDVLCSSVEF